MKSFLPLFVLSAALTGPSLLSEETRKGPLSWDHLPPLPDEEGFAGTFAGIVTSKVTGKDYLVVAGGANFP